MNTGDNGVIACIVHNYVHYPEKEESRGAGRIVAGVTRHCGHPVEWTYRRLTMQESGRILQLSCICIMIAHCPTFLGKLHALISYTTLWWTISLRAEGMKRWAGISEHLPTSPFSPFYEWSGLDHKKQLDPDHSHSSPPIIPDSKRKIPWEGILMEKYKLERKKEKGRRSSA